MALVQADGLNDLFDPFFGNLGDAGDPFPGITDNQIFGDATIPNSLLYNDVSTGHSLTINASTLQFQHAGELLNPNYKVLSVVCTDRSIIKPTVLHSGGRAERAEGRGPPLFPLNIGLFAPFDGLIVHTPVTYTLGDH